MQQILNARNGTSPTGEMSQDHIYHSGAGSTVSLSSSLNRFNNLCNKTTASHLHNVFMTCRLNRQNAAKSFFSLFKSVSHFYLSGASAAVVDRSFLVISVVQVSIWSRGRRRMVMVLA